MMEFHISRPARTRYQVNDVLFNFVGNVIFGNLAASRDLANRMNEARDTASDPEQAVHPGALFAMGLIDEVSHAMVAYYRKHHDPAVMQKALTWFEAQIGREGLDRLLLTFVDEFPNTDVFRGKEKGETWLNGSTDGMPHREAVLEEMMLLWLSNQNPAFRPFRELFDDGKLVQQTAYPNVTANFSNYFAGRPLMQVKDETAPGGTRDVSLLDLLRAPALAAPDSLSGQLAYLRQHWTELLGEDFRRILLATDVLKEEEIAIWMRFHPPTFQDHHRHWNDPIASEAEVPTYTHADQEYEAFSPDRDWMPTAVLIAKSTYVWLAQLTKQYGRQIQTLDQIPDEELATLASRGLNALWLIGIWERSRASKTIKRLCGNPDAVASAYSLASYEIAADLGGEHAYRNLRDRAAAHGIRLASDMVPNHMGIDSNWVIEHPEWFLSRPDSPYPAYKFDGPDLSHDGRVEIKIDDHYYEQTDAAVVFRRRDTWTGHVDYIYHGNDGTSFPWNDTAQLNYLNTAVREQVIQTILHVARLFPIIRFDAAMTLARRHVQRLWFPLPGSGGAIPSRAEYAMTQAEFDAAMPHEFWREVVDRVAAEVPGTLLLAEAFWLMEGYFVRTLGMHRVYNSAFMVMLRDEDNAKYRSVLKNTLEFDPDIMKRYVNFMSNPDERTAIDQFGTGDKYFGVCTMMATLPGLPMFGHGQVEGFTEKYGMEYYRPRYDEQPHEGLVARHQREIAPLLKSRALFAESANFLLYDFWREDGLVDENVFAYSNRRGDERALIVFHNHYGQTRGTIHHSAAFADKGAGELRQTSLQDALQLPADPSLFLAYRDTASNLEYLHRATDVVHHGLCIGLHAYQYVVLLHWRELRADKDHPWDRLYESLHGAGVPSLDEALVKLKLKPVDDALRLVFEPGMLRTLVNVSESEDEAAERLSHAIKANALHREREQFLKISGDRAAVFIERAYAAYLAMQEGQPRIKPLDAEELAEHFDTYLRSAIRIPQLENSFAATWPPEARTVLPNRNPKSQAAAVWAPVLGWSLIRVLADKMLENQTDDGTGRIDVEIFDQLRLRSSFAEIFASLGVTGEDSWRAAARIRIALPAGSTTTEVSSTLVWDDPDVRWLTGLHISEGVLYFNKETYEELLWWTKLPELMKLAEKPVPTRVRLQEIEREIKIAIMAAKKAGYRLEELLHERDVEKSEMTSSEHTVSVEESQPESAETIKTR